MLTKRLKKLAEICSEFLDLFFTFDPKSNGIKVFGKPAFDGGPDTKYKYLQTITAKRGAPYSKVLCLSAIRVPLIFLRVLRWRGVKILLNQNGVAYPLRYPTSSLRHNAYFKKVGQLAHHIHFQSTFALNSFRTWVGEPTSPHSVLHNGVDLSEFNPAQNVAAHPFKIVAFQDFRPWNKELWEYTSHLVQTLQKDLNYSDLHWIFIGRVSDDQLVAQMQKAISKFPKPNAVELILNPDRSTVKSALQKSNVLLHLTYNDVCPNKVTEALACGLPVIGVSAGGTAELVGDAGMIVQVKENYEREFFPETKELLEAIDQVRRNWEIFREKAIFRSRMFDIHQWLEKTKGTS